MKFSCPKQKLTTACGPVQQIGKEVPGKTSRLISYKKTVTKTLKGPLKQWVLTKQTGQLTASSPGQFPLSK